MVDNKVLVPPPPPVSSFDAFHEAQTRLGVATHALVQLARRLGAAHALGQPTAPLFEELEVLVTVEGRARAAMAEAHAELQASIKDTTKAIVPRVDTRIQQAA